MAGKSGYRIFNVELARKTQISPSMLRLVFRGGDIANMKCDSPDQRIKLLFDSLDGTPSALSNEGDWYATWLAMPKERRPTMRTYTLRAVDSQQQEMVVEFVAHGTEGPASAWAINSVPGDRLQMIAPDRNVAEDSGGYEWLPPHGLKRALLVADETALPAVRGILELIAEQPEPPQVQVFIEVPETADCVDLSIFDFAQIHWLPRDTSGAKYGEALLAGVKQHVWLPEVHQQQNLQEEGEGELLWDKATSESLDFYGWVAGESTAVKLLRRYLIGERGVAQQAINFMAYWAKGRVK